MEKRLYQMKDLIEQFGLTRDTIKYYEKRGLITPARSKSKYRIYTEEDVKKIQYIFKLKNMGLDLEECKQLLSGDESEDVERILQSVEQKLRNEIEILNRQLKSLQKYKDNI